MTRKLAISALTSLFALLSVACNGSGGGSGSVDGVDLEETDGVFFASSSSFDFPGRVDDCDDDQVIKEVTFYTDSGQTSTGPIVGVRLGCAEIGIDGGEVDFGDIEDGRLLGREGAAGGVVACTDSAVVTGFRSYTANTANPAVNGVEVECTVVDVDGDEIDFGRKTTVEFGSNSGFDTGMSSCQEDFVDSVGAVATGLQTAANGTRLAFGINPNCKRPVASN